MDWLTDPNALVGLLTLSVLEVVLNIDNVIFITILAGKLPVGKRPRARTLGHCRWRLVTRGAVPALHRLGAAPDRAAVQRDWA